MSYLSGIDFGTDQVSPYQYLDDILNNDDDNKQLLNKNGRHYSGYEYVTNDAENNINLNTITNNKKNKPNPITPVSTPNDTTLLNSFSNPSQVRNMLYNQWKLQNNSGMREGLTDFLFMDASTTILLFIIIFITIIYCMSIYSLTQQIANIYRYNELAMSMETLKKIINKQ